MRSALIIFAKHPEPGKVKTRLAATIGNEAALAVYLKLLQHTISITSALDVDKFLFYADYLMQEDLWPSAHYFKAVQNGTNLGERMKHAFDNIFQRGYSKVVIIGTDCPDLTAATIMQAFSILTHQDIVIGPAKDGGYYLLGMNKPCGELFEHIPWSTGTVFNKTMKKCVALNLNFGLLPVLTDIDDEQDLQQTKMLLL